MHSEILAGCSAMRGIIFSNNCGFCRSNSADATINDKLFRTSWLMFDNLRFNSVSCSTFNVTGSLGNPMAKHSLKSPPKATLDLEFKL